MDLMKPAVGAGALVLALGVAVPTMANGGGNKYAAQATTISCDDDQPGGGSGDFVTLNGPLKLWPPNHKMIDEPVTAQRTDKPGASVTLTLTPVVTDAVGGDGGPQHDPDFSETDSQNHTFVATDMDTPNTATAGFQVRAERSGKGEGRTYTINWNVDWGNGDSCASSDDGQAPFVITVPHDMRGGADWNKATVKQ